VEKVESSIDSREKERELKAMGTLAPSIMVVGNSSGLISTIRTALRKSTKQKCVVCVFEYGREGGIANDMGASVNTREYWRNGAIS
jgi:hypothetical protein